MKLMLEAKTLGEALDIAEANLVEACGGEENLILKSGRATVTCIREWGALVEILDVPVSGDDPA